MDNSATLTKGTQMMKNIISADILNRLSGLMTDVVSTMHNQMQVQVPGMTGNTQTSPSGAIYDNGAVADLMAVGATDGTRPPLQGKLRQGQLFRAGRVRYDGDIQEYTFKAKTDTSGKTTQEDNINFLQSRNPGKGYDMTIAGGTEYLGATQVTDNFAYCQNVVSSYFQQKDL